MRYVPAAEAVALPHVAVGRPLGEHTRLTLSNWPGSTTPREWIADTLAETALSYVESCERAHQLTGETATVDVVTCERFSTGAALALWTLLNPKAALAAAGRLTAAARAAEFGVADAVDAIAFVCAVNAYLDSETSPVADVLALEGPAREAGLFRSLLPVLGRMLTNIREFDLLWIGEYSDVLQGDALLNSGAVQIETVPDLDLVVVDTPLRLHPLIHLTASAGHSRILTVRSENTYILEYRYESWVQYRGYRPPPRVDLRGLAARLDMFERRDGRWRAEPIDVPTPMLYFDDGRRAPSPSSLARETAVAEMLDYLRGHARNATLLWSPYGRQ